MEKFMNSERLITSASSGMISYFWAFYDADSVADLHVQRSGEP
jgi:preprotein translocase subunit Sec61beta